MKNILTIFLTFAITITLLSGCANNSVDNENNMETSTSKKAETTIQTTVETTVSNNAADYLPTAYEAMLLLKDYFTQQGYNFDSWSVQNSAEDNYKMLNTSNNIGTIIINEEQLIFTIDENNQIVYSSPKYTGASNTSVIKVFSYSDLEVLDILFSNCPDDLKLSTDELKNMSDSIVPPGQKDTEKSGIEYSIIVGNNNKPVIMFNPA